jgi:hypothetical protein
MANVRSGRKKNNDRDGTGFIALPHVVIDSPAYSTLSHTAKSLLIEIARQCGRDGNGRLLCSRNHLAKRGWNSNDVISRAKAQLIQTGFIFETVKGYRPNKASWYAVTWLALGKHIGYDAGAVREFKRGAYIHQLQNTRLIPLDGTHSPSIAPLDGVKQPNAAPSSGSVFN